MLIFNIATEERAIAVHQAGHAVAALALGVGMKHRGIVVRKSKFGGVEGITYPRDCGKGSKKAAEREASHHRSTVISFAGLIAERRVKSIFYTKCDVDDLVNSVRELLPITTQGLTAPCKHGGNFWFLVYTLASCTNRERALQQIAENALSVKEDEEHSSPTLDPAIFELLWPLAQKAHAIIRQHPTTVQHLASEVLKTGSLKGKEIEALIGAESHLYSGLMDNEPLVKSSHANGN